MIDARGSMHACDNWAPCKSFKSCMGMMGLVWKYGEGEDNDASSAVPCLLISTHEHGCSRFSMRMATASSLFSAHLIASDLPVFGNSGLGVVGHSDKTLVICTHIAKHRLVVAHLEGIVDILGRELCSFRVACELLGVLNDLSEAIIEIRSESPCRLVGYPV